MRYNKEDCLLFNKCKDYETCSYQCNNSKCFEVLFNNSKIHINDYIKVLKNKFNREYNQTQITSYLLNNDKPFLLLKSSPKAEDRKLEGISILLNYIYNNLIDVNEEDILVYFENVSDIVNRDKKYFESELLLINYIDLGNEDNNNILSNILLHRCNNYKRTIITFYNKLALAKSNNSHLLMKLIMENSLGVMNVQSADN